MKKILATSLTLVGLGFAVNAAGPVPDYQWNFNMTNSTPATNTIIPTVGSEAQLLMLDFNGNPLNLLGPEGSGVSGGSDPTFPFDRAITLNGSMGGNGPVAITPDAAHALTNIGLLTNFTITAWVKADQAISGFPRIFILAGQNVDAASASFNSLGLLFFTGDNLQLKVHNTGGNGISTTTGPLAGGTSDWIFIAVSYDSTLDPTVVSNVVFYVGDRINPLGSVPNTVIPMSYIGTSVNSVAPADPNGPGYINFAGENFLNGDGSFGLTNAWCAIGNRPNRQRSFSGRYDDVRFYANKALTLAQLEAVRTDAHPGIPDPLTITVQPQNTMVAEGQGAALSVTHTPAPNASYQWYRINPGSGASNTIAGATSRDYVTPPLTLAADNGAQYAVRVHSTDPRADRNGAGIYSTYGVATVVSASQYAVTPGMLKFEYFANVTGTTVDGFLSAPSSDYPSAPNLTMYLPTFDSRGAFADDSHNNYFARITGWITPTVTTNYVFFIRAADQAQLFLSMDATTGNLNMIAQDNQGGPQVFYGPESVGGVAGGTYSTPVALIAGSNYAVQVYLKSAIGPDFVQVAWRTDSGAPDLPTNDESLADRLQPIPSAVLSCLALPKGTVSITSNPGGTSVPANSKVTLDVGVSANFTVNDSTGPLVIQWQKDGVNIPGATGTSYTTPYLSATATYRAVASIPGVTSNSSAATVNVTADNAAPTVVSATPDDSMYSVTVQFSEPVNSTALAAGNYTIPGLNVLSAAYAVNANVANSPANDAVKLTTSRQADNTSYTVTVTGVQDTTAHSIASGNTASFRSYGFASGWSKFEYFENQTDPSILDVNSFVNLSPKFTNSDPDTIVYPQQLEMSPAGTPTIRSGGVGINAFPPYYGTRMSTLVTPANTGNYIFYLSADDTAILYLSTDNNPANKHVIAYVDVANGSRNWGGGTYASSATFDTNLVGATITAVGATPWPITDGAAHPVINLSAGQRYYLEVDHLENAGFAGADSVAWDNGTGTTPAVNSAPLGGSFIGWHFPSPQITSFSIGGNNVTISWNEGQINRGASGYPGLGFITTSYPSSTLQSATVVTGPYVSLTNSSPATLPATNDMQFFRIGQ
jgi:hypothetical protein